MEIWLLLLLLLVTSSIAFLTKSFFSFASTSTSTRNLPPGPRSVPTLTPLLWFRKSSIELEQLLRDLTSKLGPIITLHSGGLLPPQIFISDRSLTHQALIQHGAIFADRPHAPPVGPTLRSTKHHEINSAGYGSTWRVLRRNLTSNILHPSKSRDLFSDGRKWVLETLVDHLRRNEGDNDNGVGVGVKVIDHFRFATFSLLVFMCFGEKLEESSIREIEEIVHRPLSEFTRFQVLNSRPWLTRVFLRSRWTEMLNWREKQNNVMIPHIQARSALQKKQKTVIPCYVDTLLNLEIFEEDDDDVKRKLTEEEMVTACAEFLAAGYDTTSTALQWIMANMVKDSNIQTKLVEEIKAVIGKEVEEVREEEISKMSYLKTVVLEGLRRHPPFHFVIPHAVTQEVELGGYTIPRNATVNFMVAEMGWDPKEWDDPFVFKPERFGFGSSSEGWFDITGSRRIKMMPFGVGRRICPGLGFSLLHLEYFVANLVWKFEWRVVEGKEVDLSEKQEFTIVMKNPLHAHISPRIYK